MRFVLASQNQEKIHEMRTILSGMNIEIYTQLDLGIHVDVEETGTTFEQNSYLKAAALMNKTGLPSIADDSGLCVEALQGAPGVYSARYGGTENDDAQRCALILNAVRGERNRRAKFVSVITCCFPTGVALAARGECHGLLAFGPQGTDGFGYDPIFLIPEKKRTFAQLTHEEKNAISHRGEALRCFRQGLTNYFSSQGEPNGFN
ncbi:MAG: RdgB/HAM1 family non-canonical purine NTP pyrophosphatase [Eubacteriales bacterium]